MSYMWLSIPLGDLPVRFEDAKWIIDIELTSLQTLEGDSYQSDRYKDFRDLDHIVKIENFDVIPGRQRYPLIKQESYLFTVIRDGEEVLINHTYPQTPTIANTQNKLPASILSIICLITAFLILQFSKVHTLDSLITGYSFLVVSIIVICLQGYLIGVPYVWIFGTPCLFLLIPLWVNLGFIPYANNKKISNSIRITLGVLVTVCLFFSVLSIIEITYFFPRGSNFPYISTTLYSIGFLAQTFAFLLSVVMLIVRHYFIQSVYNRRQVLTLVVFTGLALIPSLFSFVPLLLFKESFLPVPIAIFSLILFPFGYIFIFYRRGNTNFEPLTSKFIQIFIICISTIIVYSIILYFIERQTEVNLSLSSAALIPCIIFVVVLYPYLSTQIDKIFFGEVDSQLIQDCINKIATDPNQQTLRRLVSDIIANFSIEHYMIFLPISDQNNQISFNVFSDKNSLAYEPNQLSLVDINQPIARSHFRAQSQPPIFQNYKWAELAAPISLTNGSTGVILLSRPFGDGYFNHKEISFFDQLAKVFSLAQRAIEHSMVMQEMTNSIVKARYQERKRFATDIHDSPIQLINYGINKVRNGKDKEAIELFSNATDILRTLCHQLHDPVLKFGLRRALKHIVEKYKELGLNIEYDFDPSIAFKMETMTTSVFGQVLTESLNNIMKHSQDKKVHVSCCNDGNGLTLKIKDYGDGIPDKYLVDGIVDPRLLGDSLGVKGMFVNASSVGGQLTVKRCDKSNSGSIVELFVPLEKIKTCGVEE